MVDGVYYDVATREDFISRVLDDESNVWFR